MTEQLTVFPAFFRVAQKSVTVFGNGDEAFAKVRLLMNTQARIIAYADEPEADFAAFLTANAIETVQEPFSAVQLEGATLVFAATGDAAQDRVIVAAAREQKIPANAVDQPEFCDFLTPALVNRAPVAVAIGTEGAGPVLAQMIRAQIDQLLSPSLGALASLAQAYRDAADRLLPRGVSRRVFWRRFFSGAVADQVALGNMAEARREASRLLRSVDRVPGHVWLVGAGPGAEDLLTLRAQRVMMEADVIVYDALVPLAIVDMGRRDAERLSVGKRKGCHSKSQEEINQLLVRLGEDGKRVVRLKSGDPLVYGRAGEEMAALRDAGITYEIVPGITSAFAAAADFELPLTLRGVASSLIFTTGHDLTGDVLPDWDALRRRESELDLAAVEHGGTVLQASDMFFGHRHNLIMPGRAQDMSDGWETRRRRGEGFDWCVIKLGTAGIIKRVEIDTLWFKGNYPESCWIEAGSAQDINLENIVWRELLPEKKLQAHTLHEFADEIRDCGVVTHVRFNIFPDGGVSRLRLYGRIAE